MEQFDVFIPQFFHMKQSHRRQVLSAPETPDVSRFSKSQQGLRPRQIMLSQQQQNRVSQNIYFLNSPKEQDRTNDAIAHLPLGNIIHNQFKNEGFQEKSNLSNFLFTKSHNKIPRRDEEQKHTSFQQLNLTQRNSRNQKLLSSMINSNNSCQNVQIEPSKLLAQLQQNHFQKSHKSVLHRRSHFNTQNISSTDVALIQGQRINSPPKMSLEALYLQERPPTQSQILSQSDCFNSTMHFHLDYLFVQISPECFYREFQSKLQLNSPRQIMTFLPISPCSYQTQHPSLVVVSESDQHDLQQLLNDSISQLQSLGLKYKCTVKKQYIHDTLTFQKSLRNFAKNVVLIVGNVNLPQSQTAAQQSNRANARKQMEEEQIDEEELSLLQTQRLKNFIIQQPNRIKKRSQFHTSLLMDFCKSSRLTPQITQIEIIHPFTNDYRQNSLQQALQAYDAFIKLVFKQSAATYEANFRQFLPLLAKSARHLGLSLSKGLLSPKHLFSDKHQKANQQLLKEKVYFSLLHSIAKANKSGQNLSFVFQNRRAFCQLEDRVQRDHRHIFKFHVANGNNASLVKSVLKQRFWWQFVPTEDMSQTSLMWTQTRHQGHLFYLPSALTKTQSSNQLRIYNKLEGNYHLSNKKQLFVNLKQYYSALGQDYTKAVPLTFHVKTGLDDSEFHKFRQVFHKQNQVDKESNVWIVKPGENTNRGNGISVAKDFQELQGLIKESCLSKQTTCIVQRYIHNPLLINRRKFDIRTFALLTSVNGNLKAFFYEEGYLRTSSKEFSLDNLDQRTVHLTNDAVQCHAQDYGKYEPGNKLSYQDFQLYLDHKQINVSFQQQILPQLKQMTADCVRAVWGKIDPFKRQHSFELFGLDFMLDKEFKPYLIEWNTNPCLETPSPLQAKIVPVLLENTFKIAVDPYFKPLEGFTLKKSMSVDIMTENKYSLIFDEQTEQYELEKLWLHKPYQVNQDEESEEID